ncbi:MAG: hypothetical protein LC119_15170 [Burkholderiales bacterium]|nr:hypothetical protein [Burkholderiales bacterium]
MTLTLTPSELAETLVALARALTPHRPPDVAVTLRDVVRGAYDAPTEAS